jgi:glycosyltransferase involved in cell wall biosynthesis
MNRWLRKIVVVFDYFSQLLVFLLSLIIVLFIRRFSSTSRNAENLVLVSLARFSDTSVLHQRLNSRDLLGKFFSRPIFKHTIVLCVGDCTKRVVRLNRCVIGVDVPLPPNIFLKRFLPLTEGAIRDLLAFFITRHFLLKRQISFVEVMSPSDLMWRATLLRWATSVRLLTQVRGNLSLILFGEESTPNHATRRVRNAAIALRKQFLSQIFYRSCDTVVGYNVNNMQSAISGGAHPDKTFLSRIRVEEIFLNHEQLEDRPSLHGIPETGKLIGLWSRLGAEKRVVEATRSILPVLKRHDDAHFVIIGDGELRPVLSRIVSDAALDAHVHFLGYRSRRFIAGFAPYLSAAVVPYGGSNLLEAAMLGVPIVAFDLEWHGEIVRDGETGWLANYRDETHMGQCLDAVLTNPEEAMRRARKMQVLVREMFDDRRLDELERMIFAHFVGISIQGRGSVT